MDPSSTTDRAVAGDLRRLVTRLRHLSPRALAVRRTPVEEAIAELARIGAEAEGRAVPVVPFVADHALADALAAVGYDTLAAAGPEGQAAAKRAIDRCAGEVS